METVNVPELVERLGSDEDAVRKMAVFKLQSNIGDPSFADLFIADGGLIRLRYLTLHASGNTLAYSLTSFSRLLDVDKGWECVDQELVERVSASWSCGLHTRTNSIANVTTLDRRIDCHTPPRQYPPWRNVHSRLDCLSSIQYALRRPLRVPRPQTRYRHIPPVLRDASEQAFLRRSCVVRQCLAIN
jgi:hypothetical protein